MINYTLIVDSNNAGPNQLLSCIGSFATLLDQPVRSIYILNPYKKDYDFFWDCVEFRISEILKLNTIVESWESLYEVFDIQTDYIWVVNGNSVLKDENAIERIFNFIKSSNQHRLNIQGSIFTDFNSFRKLYVSNELQDIIRKL